jgi:large subunit ribosomal protein L4
MKVSIYNIEGKQTGFISLPKEIFQVDLNHDLVYQVVLAQQSNRRKNIAHTKDRSEVRGGGRKPWRQKGTGRARHGSRRSPIWKGGGVTFGPRNERNFKKKINKKIKRKALFMVLSEKLRKDLLFFFDQIKLEQNKTKETAGLIKKWQANIDNFKKGKILIVLAEQDKKFVLAARNLPNTIVIEARDLNALALLESKYLIMTKPAIKLIKDTFLKEKTTETEKQENQEKENKD